MFTNLRPMLSDQDLACVVAAADKDFLNAASPLPGVDYVRGPLHTSTGPSSRGSKLWQPPVLFVNLDHLGRFPLKLFKLRFSLCFESSSTGGYGSKCTFLSR